MAAKFNGDEMQKIVPMPIDSRTRDLTLILLVIVIGSILMQLMYTVLAGPELPPQNITVSFDRQLSGERVGQHKAGPLLPVNITVTVSASTNITNATLIDYYPSTWNVSDTGGGNASAYNETYDKIEWLIGNIASGTSVSRSYILTSPQRTLPPTKYYFYSELVYEGASEKSGGWMVIVADPSGTPAKVVGYLDQFVYLFGNKSGTWKDDSSPPDGVVWPSKAYASGTAWHTQIEEVNTIRAYVMVLDAEGKRVPSQTVKAWVIDRTGNQTNKTCVTGSDGTCELVWEAWKHPDDGTAGADQDMYGKFDSRKIYNVTIDYNSDDVGDLNLSFMAYCILDTFFGTSAAGKTAGHCEGQGSCDPHGKSAHFTADDQSRSDNPSCVDCHGVVEGISTPSTVTGYTLMPYAGTHPRPTKGAVSTVAMCWNSTCHDHYSSDPIGLNMRVPGWDDETYNTTNPWYGNASWTNGSWCASSGCHNGTYTPFNDSIIPVREGHNKNISCKYCHSDNFHNTPTIANTPGYNDTEYYGTCYKDCHTTQVNHNNNASVNCATCHYNASTAPMHQQNLTSNYTTCGSCHQNNGFSGAPQVPYPLEHSDDSSAGQKWNKTDQYYWNDSATGFTNSSCAYCHGNVFMNATALGRPSQWKGVNTLNSSINATNSWCAGCHYQGYVSGSDSYSTMTSTFEGAGLSVPPEITNHSQYAPDEISGYYNHSFTDAPYYNDSRCQGCHGSLISGSYITEFIHQVAIGAGCRGCHFSLSYMSGRGNETKYVNQTLFEQSVHGNESVITCEDCHTNTTGHPGADPSSTRPPESGWKWCEDCHVVYQNTSKPNRHNLTDNPPANYYNSTYNVMDVKNCRWCHSAQLYDNAIATYNRTSGKDCRWCHTLPDKYPDSIY